jgi:Kef-type K+ transport system membrane component KefB
VFFVSAFAVGHYVVPHVFPRRRQASESGVLLVLSIAFCFWLSWLATRVELAAIVGASLQGGT